MIFIKEHIPSIIKLEYIHKENNYGLITINCKNIVIEKKITLYIKEFNKEEIFAIGYFNSFERKNNIYIYEYMCFNYKKYMDFSKKLFNENKDLMITNNILDMQDGFLYIDPVNHHIEIKELQQKEIKDPLILEDYSKYILEEDLKFFTDENNIKVNFLYPIIEIHEDLIFTIPEDDEKVFIIHNILNNWTSFQKNRILKLTYEEDIKSYIIKIPNILYTRKILEYTINNKNTYLTLNTYFNKDTKEFQQDEEKNYKEININYDSIKSKPKTIWKIIKNICFNAYIYNNPISVLNITLMYIPKNLYVNSYLEYNKLFFQITKIHIVKDSNFLCKITCVLYKSIYKDLEDLKFNKYDEQVLEYKYNSKFEEIFFYDKENEEVIFKEKIYKNYTYKKSTII
jgi:hypothetical protein